MIFGDPDDFAIEAGVEPFLTAPSQVWGFMCVWCRGIPLGDIEERTCGLGPAYQEFVWLLEHLDEKWDAEFAGMSDQETWDRLDGLLYGSRNGVELDDARTLEEMRADWGHYSKFDFLTNLGESFDGYKSFLLCPPDAPVRVLSRRLPASLGLSVQVSKQAVLEASRGFVQWFGEQETRLHSRHDERQSTVDGHQ